MKKNNQGFTLIETLIISAFVIGTLIYLYSQFVVLKNNYNYSFKYNTVENIYKIKNIDKYLLNEAMQIKNGIITSNLGYVDLNNCNNLVTNNDYCTKLLNALDVKTLIIANEDLNGLKNALKNNNPYTEGLYKFVNRQKTGVSGNSYRIVVEFKDNTFGTIISRI